MYLSYIYVYVEVIHSGRKNSPQRVIWDSYWENLPVWRMGGPLTEITIPVKTYGVLVTFVVFYV